MKKSPLVLLAFLAFFPIARAQWITLYEGGVGTPNNLKDDWTSVYFMYGENNAFFLTQTLSIDNNVSSLYYSDLFLDGRIGMWRAIPGMENYASIRVYADLTLEDSVGYVTYASALDETDAWHPFDSVVSSVNVPFYNEQGHRLLLLDTQLLRADSVRMSYDYIRIEADTTAMLHTTELATFAPQVFAHGATVVVAPQQPDETYELRIISAAGNELYRSTTAGKQVIATDFTPGIYFVSVSNGTNSFRRKVFLE